MLLECEVCETVYVNFNVMNRQSRRTLTKEVTLQMHARAEMKKHLKMCILAEIVFCKKKKNPHGF